MNEGTPRAGPHRPGLGFRWVVLSGPLLVRRFCAPPCPLLPVLPLLSSGGLLSLSTMLSPLPVLLLLSVCRPSAWAHLPLAYVVYSRNVPAQHLYRELHDSQACCPETFHPVPPPVSGSQTGSTPRAMRTRAPPVTLPAGAAAYWHHQSCSWPVSVLGASCGTLPACRATVPCGPLPVTCSYCNGLASAV